MTEIRRDRAATVRTVGEIILIAAFIISLWLPLVGMTTHGQQPLGPLTGEEHAPFPEVALDLPTLTAFPQRFSAYVDTNLGFRTTLIGWHGLLKVKWFGVSSSSRVVIGKQGWLFTNERDCFCDYRGMRPFPRGGVLRFRRALQERHDWLAAQGILYLVVIVPEAYWTYSEYLPAMMPRVRDSSRMDELIADMRAHSNVRILDLRPALRRGKIYGRLYHKTDPHWNQLGAYVAYVEIVKALEEWFPSLRPADLGAFRISSTRSRGGALARLLGLKDAFSEERVMLKPRRPRAAREVEVVAKPRVVENVEVLFRDAVVTECPHAQGGRLVMFRDSYGEQLIPYLSEHFSYTVYCWTWVMAFDRAVIERVRPSVVIQQAVERQFLNDSSPDDSGRILEAADLDKIVAQ